MDTRFSPSVQSKATSAQVPVMSSEFTDINFRENDLCVIASASDHFTDEIEGSVFTKALFDVLKSSGINDYKVDLNMDGIITFGELTDQMQMQVRKRSEKAAVSFSGLLIRVSPFLNSNKKRRIIPTSPPPKSPIPATKSPVPDP